MISRFLCAVLLSGIVVPVVSAQSPGGDPPVAVRLTAVDAPEDLAAGAVGHFRAQVAPQSTRPVNFLWDFGDGTLSVGSPVSHVYARRGTYDLTVVARNAGGADTARASVAVRLAEPDADAEAGASRVTAAAVSDPVAATQTAPTRSRRSVSRTTIFGSGGVTTVAGGYTWVVTTDLWAERARNRMLAYRLNGYRADVYVDTSGRGSAAHRVVVGQFATAAEARVARRWLPADVVSPWLLPLSSPPAQITAREGGR
jgi:hypothetical protein